MNDLSSLADGLFYPADNLELDALLTGLLVDNPGGFPVEGESRLLEAVISPHGAYEYCGSHIATALATLKNHNIGKSIKRIIIASPLHRESEDGLYLTDKDGITLPCGRLSFDTVGARILEKKQGFKTWEVPFSEEPGIELHLPFIIKLFPDIPVLPIYGRMEKAASRKALASALRALPDSLIVLSSNLGEYRPREESLNLAEEFIGAVESLEKPFDPGEWLRERKGGLPKPCGIRLLEALCLSFKKEEGKNSIQLKTLSWGPDVPAQEAGEKDKKAAYYAAFALYAKKKDV